MSAVAPLETAYDQATQIPRALIERWHKFGDLTHLFETPLYLA